MRPFLRPTAVPAFGDIAFLAIGPIKVGEVVVDAGVDLPIGLPTLATVRFLSRLLTALNLLPSIATMALVKRSADGTAR